MLLVLLGVADRRTGVGKQPRFGTNEETGPDLVLIGVQGVTRADHRLLANDEV